MPLSTEKRIKENIQRCYSKFQWKSNDKFHDLNMFLKDLNNHKRKYAIDSTSIYQLEEGDFGRESLFQNPKKKVHKIKVSIPEISGTNKKKKGLKKSKSTFTFTMNFGRKVQRNPSAHTEKPTMNDNKSLCHEGDTKLIFGKIHSGFRSKSTSNIFQLSEVKTPGFKNQLGALKEYIQKGSNIATKRNTTECSNQSNINDSSATSAIQPRMLTSGFQYKRVKNNFSNLKMGHQIGAMHCNAVIEERIKCIEDVTPTIRKNFRNKLDRQSQASRFKKSLAHRSRRNKTAFMNTSRKPKKMKPSINRPITSYRESKISSIRNLKRFQDKPTTGSSRNRLSSTRKSFIIGSTKNSTNRIVTADMNKRRASIDSSRLGKSQFNLTLQRPYSVRRKAATRNRFKTRNSSLATKLSKITDIIYKCEEAGFPKKKTQEFNFQNELSHIEIAMQKFHEKDINFNKI
ncbi:unnamed protein product [Moneuplotes crassus]|uniref:Uncharacterized protein n=1 Tax=Euplotes crassus TaxID=5936 RepID=A0AAD1YDH5_EUPCR|nr:unnamed protein product [Moneuplotes crassus]